MASRPSGGRPPSGPKLWSKPGAKPGATREQVERRERFERARRDALRATDGDGPVIMYGWHTVTAALRNPTRHIRKLLATDNAARRLAEEGIAPTRAPEVVRPSAIAERLLPDAVHQGLYLETDPLPSPAVEEIAGQGVVLVLDRITDPHNVGAIFRSAAAFAATAIVTTQRHSPDATGALAKAASGALEQVPLVNVQNLARGLAALKANGFLVVGLDSSGDADLSALTLRKPLALVLGAEGKGLRQLTKETCDHIARIDLPGGIKSLNVSNAAALSLYIASRAS
ncbi:MAG TPA: 23S rRNA (guanosine(2251)-2'-O)-methyltransferase RlmB [Pseudolabrys sp.]|nr:23S rRNA (guanosine(2251)-2'-O)-methyltransferase RlmB [Pseudolabrys sp.]